MSSSLLKRNILILYYSKLFPLRSASKDHLYSFRDYSTHRCFYLNLAVRNIPWYINSIPIDLVIFHTSLLGTRGSSKTFENMVRKLRKLDTNAPKIILPQDEHQFTKQLQEIIKNFNVTQFYKMECV